MDETYDVDAYVEAGVERAEMWRSPDLQGPDCCENGCQCYDGENEDGDYGLISDDCDHCPECCSCTPCGYARVG